MTINGIKIELIIIEICCLVGFGAMVVYGSTSEIDKLVSCEEDNRTCDVNYLDMPAESGENGVWHNLLFYTVFFIMIGVGGGWMFYFVKIRAKFKKNVKNP